MISTATRQNVIGASCALSLSLQKKIEINLIRTVQEQVVFIPLLFFRPEHVPQRLATSRNVSISRRFCAKFREIP